MEKRNEIDLVILDMIMPGISGGETFDRLRAINPDVRVLLSSGYSINGEAKHIMERGCNGFIQKPFQSGKTLKQGQGDAGLKRRFTLVFSEHFFLKFTKSYLINNYIITKAVLIIRLEYQFFALTLGKGNCISSL